MYPTVGYTVYLLSHGGGYLLSHGSLNVSHGGVGLSRSNFAGRSA